MPVASKRLCRGALGAANETLYTTPSGSGSYTVVKAVTLCNTTAGAVAVTLAFGGVAIVCSYRLAAYDTVTIPFIDQILGAGEIIEGHAGSAASVNYYISGKEVT